MKIDVDFVKKRYYDTRVGVTTVSPLIALVNFILLSYNFSTIKESLNIWTFGILVASGLIVALTIIGVFFRKKQYKIDLAYMYLENKEQLKTDLIILNALERFYPPGDEKSKMLHSRIGTLKAYLGET
jgi:membrane protein YdbS with pleckstrin-like domain